MFLTKIAHTTIKAIKDAGAVTRHSFSILKNDPQILAYPYLAGLFVLVTFPIVNSLAFRLWDSIAHSSIFSVTDNAPRDLRILLGLVTFSFFYSTFVSAYFTCAVSAAVLAKLEGHSTPPLYGFRIVLSRFRAVTKFALLAVFFFPISIFAQRRKVPTRDILSVIGSSLSLNMSQLAPVILTEKKSTTSTIRQAVDTLGAAWHEGLVIKIGTYLVLILLLAIGFLPKLLEDYWFDDHTARVVGALAGVLLSLTAYVVTKVTSSVVTTTLYHQAKTTKNK